MNVEHSCFYPAPLQREIISIRSALGGASAIRGFCSQQLTSQRIKFAKNSNSLHLLSFSQTNPSQTSLHVKCFETRFRARGAREKARASSFIFRLNENWSFFLFLSKSLEGLARIEINIFREIPGIRFVMPQNRWKVRAELFHSLFFSSDDFFNYALYDVRRVGTFVCATCSSSPRDIMQCLGH